MYLTIIFLPLLGSLLTGFGGRWLGYYGSSLVSTSCVFFCMLLSLLAFFEVSFCQHTIFLNICPWICSGYLEVSWSFLFDSLTVVMLIVITFVSTLVHVYSIDYMKNDPHFPRFMAYLEIFTFFMLLLVTADNVVQMFLGWEGVGLTSYLLINFWFTRLSANRAALKALILNRIGDFGLLLAILAIFCNFKSLNYLTIFSLSPFFLGNYLTIFSIEFYSLTFVSVLLFVGAIGKSAQLGLHTWLPDAMEGPTPVSALIHAATMVTAGVFLIIRFSPLIEYSSFALSLMIVLGSLTSFFAAVTGVFQNDLKKVIAYSTCSQLGYMIFCCGLSNYNVSIFHLTNHAFFKALLFLCAGSVIHAMNDEQDMRRMGSIIEFTPVTYSLMLVGSLALAGTPFLTGFYSKDVILEISNVYRNNNLNFTFSSMAFWFGNLAVFFTAYYSFRLLFFTFINNSNFSKYLVVRESSYLLLFPLIILTIGSIFFGYILKDLFVGLGVNTWNNVIFMHPLNNFFLESEYLYVGHKWLPFTLSIFGISMAFIINTLKFNYMFFVNLINFFFYFLSKKWYFDAFYNKAIVFPVLNFAFNTTYKNLDRGFIELVGPFGFSYLIPNISHTFSKLHTGRLTHYIFLLVFVLCLILSFNFLSFFYLVVFFFILSFWI